MKKFLPFLGLFLLIEVLGYSVFWLSNLGRGQGAALLYAAIHLISLIASGAAYGINEQNKE